jgi:hypothetical protein
MGKFNVHAAHRIFYNCCSRHWYPRLRLAISLAGVARLI